MTWVIVPAAGRGTRFGARRPKQYLHVVGQPLLAHTLDALLSHRGITGALVVLDAADGDWPGWSERCGKPVHTCSGGAERADSVLAGLRALPNRVGADDPVLVHDAARPNLHHADLDALLQRGQSHPVGAILAAPVRDTLKRADEHGAIAATEPRERLWRALTPQLFRREALTRALQSARAAGITVTDEAGAMEHLGLRPLLVEGREDNLKITTSADFKYFEFLLARKRRARAET